VTPNAEQYEALANWQYKEGVDFWRLYAVGHTSHVMIAPEKQKDFEMFLSSMNITNRVKIDNLESLLEEERQSMARNRRGKSTVLPGMVPDFSVYWSATEMQQYSEFLAERYPQFVTIETMVFSPQGRRIYALKVSSGTFGQKPIIAMESGMHAREWVCPPTVLYLLHRLIEVPESRNELLRDVDWLIVPMQVRHFIKGLASIYVWNNILESRWL
jgi:Zinc carboxypeptidase/Carboxypeptidase activation peptide